MKDKVKSKKKVSKKPGTSELGGSQNIRVTLTVETAPKEIDIVFVIDESGSMAPRQSQIISGFNEYIQDRKTETAGVKYRVSLVKFNYHATTVYTAKPLSEVPDLQTWSYTPSGGTALVDAVCDAINAESVLAGSRPVILVVMTDGEENSSARWTSQQLSALVQGKEASGKWTIIYLGANQNAWGLAQQYGFQRGNVIRYDGVFTAAAMSNVSMASSVMAHNYATVGATATTNYRGMADFKSTGDEEDETPLGAKIVP